MKIIFEYKHIATS